MSEAAYSHGFANHTYGIVRSPRQHVVSQFFHCKEAKEHHRRDLMPSLDEWLDAWTMKMKSGPLIVKDLRSSRTDPKFHCYVPINLQSRYLGFDKSNSKQDLASRFDVLGVSSQMHKSLCVIAIRFSEVVPGECNCTSSLHRRLGRYDHGVLHHGGTFNLTSTQTQLIDNLIHDDELLHRYAQDIFEEQARDVEEKYSIQLCDTKEQALSFR